MSEQQFTTNAQQTPYYYYPQYQSPPFYNPYQARLQSLEQANPQLMPQQPQFTQQPQPQPQQAGNIKVRQVSNADEARAAQIDFDGSLYVFADVSNGCIYTKKLITQGQDAGKVPFDIYVKKTEGEVAQQNTTATATAAATVAATATPEKTLTLDAIKTYLDKYTEDMRLQITALEKQIKERAKDATSTSNVIAKTQSDNVIVTKFD